MNDKSLQAKIEDAQEHTQKAEQLVSAAEDELEKLVAEEKDVDGEVTAFYSTAEDAFRVSITDDDLVDSIVDHTGGDISVSGGSMTLTISPDGSLTPTTGVGRDRVKSLKELIASLEDNYDQGAPVDEVLAHADAVGLTEQKAEKEIESLRKKGELYEPVQGHLRTT